MLRQSLFTTAVLLLLSKSQDCVKAQSGSSFVRLSVLVFGLGSLVEKLTNAETPRTTIAKISIFSASIIGTSLWKTFDDLAEGFLRLGVGVRVNSLCYKLLRLPSVSGCLIKASYLL